MKPHLRFADLFKPTSGAFSLRGYLLSQKQPPGLPGSQGSGCPWIQGRVGEWSATRALTLVLQVAQVQDGGQELRDLPVLGVGEHEHLHGGADVGILLAVLTALTGYAVTLGESGCRRASGAQRDSACTGEPSCPAKAAWSSGHGEDPDSSRKSRELPPGRLQNTFPISGTLEARFLVSRRSEATDARPRPCCAPLWPWSPALRDLNPSPGAAGRESTARAGPTVCVYVCVKVCQASQL